MQAYDILFGEPGDLRYRPGEGTAVVAPDALHAGWTGSAGPAIDPATWPRGPITGLPMMHLMTLRLPEDYRRQGAGLPGIAFFQGEGQFADDEDPVVPDPASDDPFLAELAGTHAHATLRLLEDIIGGRFALLWLTEAELAGPTPPPADSRRPGEHPPYDEGPNAWDDVEPTVRVWLTVRDDPNAGRAPDEDGEGGYELPDVDSLENPPLFGRCHLGGTAFPVQAMPDGLTPYYLELEELARMNLGGDGTLQLDLESDSFDWACG